MNLDIQKINKVYLSGIGGIGLSSLAYYFLQLQKQVLGSDLFKSEVTRRLEERGVLVDYKQKASNITNDIDLFVYTSALPDDHPEFLKARKLKIPVLSYFEFLGYLSKQYKTIAVAGTNGKTTTTAMLGLIMEKAGLDPMVIVGSLVPQWGSNFRFGRGEWLVVEACEWQAHMLEINPQIIVLTNIAEDHLDYFRDLSDIKKHFQKFVNKLPKGGWLVKNADDKNSRSIVWPGKLITVGRENSAHYNFSAPVSQAGQQHFSVNHQRKLLADFDLAVPGIYNIYNALQAVAVADTLGINKHQIWNALHDFSGIWRRFEPVGQWKNNIIISDYAHHPDAIRGLLQATKEFYPNKKIIAIFQPHHHNRTQTLLHEFAASFRQADQVVITDIYQVAGREDKAHEAVSSQDLVALIKDAPVNYAPKTTDIKKVLRQINPSKAVILFIGAGDIDTLARELAK
ncbi:MAG: UDP-N-acetylmuramate--L-alanine ligase [Patescibacteria group bacterium]